MSRWYRMYDDLIDDPKVQRLDPVLFKTWVNLLCLASRNDGSLPCIEDMAFALRLDEETTKSQVQVLVEKGLIDDVEQTLRPHNWDKRQFKSDSDPTATERQRAKRERDKGVTRDKSVTSHPPETEQSRTDTESESPLPPLKEFPEKEFAKFIEAYPKRDVAIIAARARAAFEDAVEQSSVETVMASLRAYIDECRADERIGTKYVKNPQNWLADQDWKKLKEAPATFPVKPVLKDTAEWEALKKKKGGKLFATVLRDPDTQRYLGEGTWVQASP
jgi:hypothetical protein